MSGQQPAPTRSRIIAKNFFRRGLEVGVTIFGVLATNIAIARIIGPVKLGYYNYVYWLTSITASIGSLGIPLAVFKYMGEYLGAGDRPLARAVYRHAFRIQLLIALCLCAVGQC